MYISKYGAVDGFKAGVKGRIKNKGYYDSNPIKLDDGINRPNGETLFNDCVWQAYCDAARKFSSVNKVVGEKNKEDILNALAERIIVYFNRKPAPQSPEEYDEWHKETCDEFRSEFLKYNGYKVTYGMAQKVLNLSFKYLYCCKDANQYSEYFKYCHMTFDDFMLAWYTRIIDPKNSITEWSTLDNYGVYLEMQNKIRDHLNSPSNVTIKNNATIGSVLEYELYLFPDETVYQTLDALRNAIEKYSNGKHSNIALYDYFNKKFDNKTIIDFFDELK